MEFKQVQVRNSQFEKSLFNKVARVISGLEREVENELKVSFALTFSQFRVLDALLTTGEVSQRDLAERLKVSPAVVTRQAEVLHAEGLLIQRNNPLSKRENLLKLTIKGEGAAVDAAKHIAERQKLLFAALSRQDETAFIRAIDVLYKDMEDRS
jgi:DNA-binding MarR family transcriptional regulator